VLSSRAEGGKEERRRKKKKRGERGAFFFRFWLRRSEKLFFCSSKLTSACARDIFRTTSCKSFYHRQHDATKSRPFALVLSLTIFLSSLNNLHSLLLKNENIFERVFSMCKIKILPLCPRKEISLGSKAHVRQFFSKIKGLPRVLHITTLQMDFYIIADSLLFFFFFF